MTSGSMATAMTMASRRRPASARTPAGAALRADQQAVRMNLFVLVRILFQYLERVDSIVLDLAKEVLKDCERKHNTKDSKYNTLADAINERVRDAVGETHWTQARKIQTQLTLNQQKKKMRAMAFQKHRIAMKRQAQEASREESMREGGGEATVRAMSALSQSVIPSTDLNTPNIFAQSVTSMDQGMGNTSCSGGSNVPVRSAVGPSSLRISSSVAGTDENGAGRGGGAPKSVPFKKRIMFASPPTSSTFCPN